MKVVFHVISLGNGGSGASRVTRYISERDRDPKREGADSRPLFSHDQDDLSYRKADRILLRSNANQTRMICFIFLSVSERKILTNSEMTRKTNRPVCAQPFARAWKV